MLNTLTTYSQIPLEHLEYLLSLDRRTIFQDTLYQALVQRVDTNTLDHTLAELRRLYEIHLPQIKTQHHLHNTTMSGATLGNWVLGFASYPGRLPDLLERHERVPRHVIAAVLPELLAVVEHLSTGAQAWHYALTVFSLPLLLEQ